MMLFLVLMQMLTAMLVMHILFIASNFIAVIFSGIVSMLMVLMYSILRAPDIAITEAAIGIATTTCLFTLTFVHLDHLRTKIGRSNFKELYSDIRKKIIIFCFGVLLFGTLLYLINELLVFSSLNPVKEDVTDFYIQNAKHDFGFPSIVTSIVAGYRAFDTLFETIIVMSASLGFRSLYNSSRDKE